MLVAPMRPRKQGAKAGWYMYCTGADGARRVAQKSFKSEDLRQETALKPALRR
jgi:hypothetical protein